MKLRSTHVKICGEAHAALAAMARAHNKTLGGMAADLLAEAILGRARHYAPVDNLQDRSGHVYVIRCGDRYKIGKAKDVDRRLKHLQLPSVPEKIATKHFADAFAAEKSLHIMFKHARERGEWFRLNVPEVNQLRAAIEQLN